LSTTSRAHNFWGLQHGAQDYYFIPSRRISLSPGVLHNLKAAKGVITRTTRISAYLIPSRIAKYFNNALPVEDGLLNVKSALSDGAMDDSVESHHPWMTGLAEKGVSDQDDDEDFFRRDGLPGSN
jgi:hypothetical protein